MARSAPHGSELALVVETPDVLKNQKLAFVDDLSEWSVPLLRIGLIITTYLDSIAKLVTKDFARGPTHVLVPSREDDFVGREFSAVGEKEGTGLDLADFLALFDFDLAVDDKLGGADINVVASAALEVFHEEAYLGSFSKDICYVVNDGGRRYTGIVWSMV